MFVRADQLRQQRDVIGQKRIGDHTPAACKVLARVPGLDRWRGSLELLSVNAAEEHLKVERVVFEDRQLCDEVGDPVIGSAQGRQPAILPVRFVQHVIRNVAGLRHREIAEVGRLRNNHRHQAVRVGDLLRITGLQGRHCRQEVAALIHKPDDIGNIAQRQLCIEAVLSCGILVGFWLTPRQGAALRVVVEVLEPAFPKFAVEAFPEVAKLVAQGVDGDIYRLT
ncbi:hypothetical protein R69746_08833 [Paraburkholderia aspalathi]|nr:hypothetical protein R69746_08833 [Paraburkholderia aspalathi]